MRCFGQREQALSRDVPRGYCTHGPRPVADSAVREPHFPNRAKNKSDGGRFWEIESDYQRGGEWLRHSRAVEWLKPPANVEEAITDYGARCGPISFAAITGLPADDSLRFFPESQFRPWTSRNDMNRAFRESGRECSRKSEWPTVGLCLVQFTGPWTERNFPAASLQHTHWIAVLGAYVYDINWGGWLPRENWEEIVLADLLNARPAADGWCLLASYELPIAATLMAATTN